MFSTPTRRTRRIIMEVIAFLIVYYCVSLPTLGEASSSPSCDSYNVSSTTHPQLSVAAINNILAEHNAARRRVFPWARYMPMLQWDAKLAEHARKYIVACPGLVHSSSTYRSNVQGDSQVWSYVGENLAAGTSTSSYGNTSGGATSTRAWNDEVKYWTHGCTNADSCTGTVGHYTQVIWNKTTHVGCASAYCPNQAYKNYWICHYAPGGNIVGALEYESTSTRTMAATCQDLAATATSFALSPATAAATMAQALVILALTVVAVALSTAMF